MSSKYDLRENERAVDAPAPGDAAVQFIGKIHTPFTTRDLCPRQGDLDGPECRIVVDGIWVPALQGLEAFERVEVLYWLHQSRRDLVLQSPKSDGATRGTFSLRSPVRPNPIGISSVRLLSINGAELVVQGLDCLDGTPLIDLKPDRGAFTPQVPPKPADQS